MMKGSFMNIGDIFENPGIELVSFSNDIVTFRSAQKFTPADRVTFEVAGQNVKIQVEGVSFDEEGSLFSGRALIGKEVLDHHFAQPVSYQQQKRRAPRVPHRMRIVSREIPSFQALSLDFSPLGLRVQLEGAIAEGQTIPLLIDFDWPGQEPLETSARVVWCRRDQNQYLAGLEFIDVNQITGKLIEAFYHEMLSGEVGDVAKAVAHKHRLESTMEPAVSTKKEPSRTKFNISGHIESYAVKADSLRVVLVNEQNRTHLNFSELYFLRDYRGLAGLDVTCAWELSSSPELHEATAHRPRRLMGPAPDLSHLQFMNRTDLVVLELVACPTRIPSE